MGNQHGSAAFEALPRLNLPQFASYSQPICLTQNNASFIFIMPMQTRKWIKYNITYKQFMNPEHYPDKIQLMSHSSSVDTETKHIYILNGTHKLFMIFDAKNADNPWCIYTKFNCKCGSFPSVCYVQSPSNEFHVITTRQPNSSHLKWDANKNDFVEIYKFGETLQHSAFIYVASKQQLFLMGGIRTDTMQYIDSIYVATINDNTWKWNKLTRIQMPYKMAKIGYVLYDNRYIVLFGGEIGKDEFLDTIFVFDVNNYETDSIYQWIPVDQRCPRESIYFALQHHQNIHLFQRDDRHHKQWVFDISNLTINGRSLSIISDEKQENTVEIKCEEEEKRVVETEVSSNLKSVFHERMDDDIKEESKIDIIASLQQHLNEVKLENERLRQENRKLRRKCIVPSLYYQWDTQDVIEWILSLENERFDKYEKKLKQTLCHHKTKGTDLKDFNELSMKFLGIDDDDDRNSLLNHIRCLYQQGEQHPLQQADLDDVVVAGVNVLPTNR